MIPDGALLSMAVKDGLTADSIRDLEADHKIFTQIKNLLTCSSLTVQLQAVKQNINVEAVWRF